jgi:hypothetical protein
MLLISHHYFCIDKYVHNPKYSSKFNQLQVDHNSPFKIGIDTTVSLKRAAAGCFVISRRVFNLSTEVNLFSALLRDGYYQSTEWPNQPLNASYSSWHAS